MVEWWDPRAHRGAGVPPCSVFCRRQGRSCHSGDYIAITDSIESFIGGSPAVFTSLSHPTWGSRFSDEETAQWRLSYPVITRYVTNGYFFRDICASATADRVMHHPLTSDKAATINLDLITVRCSREVWLIVFSAFASLQVSQPHIKHI